MKTVNFHCREHRFDLWLGNKNPICHAMWPENKKFFKSMNLIREVRKCRKKRKTAKQAKLIILQPVDKVKDLYLFLLQGL